MICLMFTRCFQELDLKLYKKELELYNNLLMSFILDEFNDRWFVADKIYKATKNGTRVKFKRIKNFEEAKNRIIEIAKKLNQEIKIEENRK